LQRLKSKMVSDMALDLTSKRSILLMILVAGFVIWFREWIHTV